MRVLDLQQVHHLDPVRVGPERRGDLVGCEQAALARHPMEGDAGQDRRRGNLGGGHVGSGLGGDEVAGASEHVDGDLVGHGSRGDVDRALFAGDLGAAVLEPIHRGVVPVPVVADLGLCHGPAHRRRGLGHGVRAEVDRACHPARV